MQDSHRLHQACFCSSMVACPEHLCQERAPVSCSCWNHFCLFLVPARPAGCASASWPCRCSSGRRFHRMLLLLPRCCVRVDPDSRLLLTLASH